MKAAAGYGFSIHLSLSTFMSFFSVYLCILLDSHMPKTINTVIYLLLESSIHLILVDRKSVV